MVRPSLIMLDTQKGLEMDYKITYMTFHHYIVVSPNTY